MSVDKKLVKVAGLLADVTNNQAIGTLGKAFEFEMEPTVERLLVAWTAGEKVIPVGMKFKVRATIRQLSAGWIAAMTGATAANGLLKPCKEQLTKAANALTLTNHGGNKACVMVTEVYDTVNKTYRYKAGAAVANDAYTYSAGVLTLHASDAGTVFDVTYIYTDSTAAAGVKLIIPPTALPSQIRLILCYGLLPTTGGAISDYICIDAQKCQLVGAVKIGGEIGSFSETPIELECENTSSGDIVWYTPDNPAW
jgi:hypothetical protein